MMRAQVGVEALHTPCENDDEDEDSVSDLDDEAVDDAGLLERLDALGLYEMQDDNEEAEEVDGGSADEWEDIE